jgi:hypothetical protein
VGARDPCRHIRRQGSRALCLLLPALDGDLAIGLGQRRTALAVLRRMNLARCQPRDVPGFLNVSHGTGVISMGCNGFACQPGPPRATAHIPLSHPCRRQGPAAGGAPSGPSLPRDRAQWYSGTVDWQSLHLAGTFQGGGIQCQSRKQVRQSEICHNRQSGSSMAYSLIAASDLFRSPAVAGCTQPAASWRIHVGVNGCMAIALHWNRRHAFKLWCKSTRAVGW